MGQSQLKHPESTRLHFQSLINRIQYRFLDYYHPDDPIRQDILKQVIITELVWLINRYEQGQGINRSDLMVREYSSIKLKGRNLTQWQRNKMFDLLLAIDPQRVYQKADVIYEKRSLENGST